MKKLSKVKNLLAENWNKFWAFSFAAYFGMLASIAPALATDSSGAIQDGINNGAEQLWNILKSIVAPIAVVFLGWAGVKTLFFGERGMDGAKSTVITIIIVLALVLLAPLVITQIKSWFESASGWSF